MKISLMLVLLGSLTACGTYTGLPGHGGGKRFAVEQELVAATARAAANKIAQQSEIQALKGRNCTFAFSAMGDDGSGNLIGGRYSLEAAIRGDYLNNPTSRTTNVYPVITTTSTTGATTTVAENALNSARTSQSQTKGAGGNIGVGASYQGIGAFSNVGAPNPRDMQFLTNALVQAFLMKGINIVANQGEEPACSISVTVDVFGTIRNRTDWHVINQERLVAKTSLEVVVFGDQQVLVSPKRVSFAAEYIERFVFWAGPTETIKHMVDCDAPTMGPGDVSKFCTPVVLVGNNKR